MSLDEEPDMAVIVVRVSERVDENGELTGQESEIYYADNNSGAGRILTAPSTPSGLTLSHGSANSIILQWLDVANETGYEIYRMDQPNYWYSLVGTTSANNNDFVNYGLTSGTKVWYKVRAKNTDGTSAWSPIMATFPSSRNDGESLKIKRMRFSKSALNKVESWVGGAPELRVRVIKGSSTGASFIYTSGRFEPRKRNDIKDSWWSKTITVASSWDTNTFGTVLTFDWQEEDRVNDKTYNVSASYEDKSDGGTLKAGGSVSFKVNKDGIIGNTAVLWWDPKDQIYDISGFKWQFVY